MEKWVQNNPNNIDTNAMKNLKATIKALETNKKSLEYKVVRQKITNAGQASDVSVTNYKAQITQWIQ